MALRVTNPLPFEIESSYTTSPPAQRVAMLLLYRSRFSLVARQNYHADGMPRAPLAIYGKGRPWHNCVSGWLVPLEIVNAVFSVLSLTG